MSFQTEEIPDVSKLFYRIHICNIDHLEADKKRKIKPGAFDPQPKPDSTQMSVDWDKYSNALDTRNRARIPSKNGVISFKVLEVKQSPIPLKVAHQPSVHNQAHSIIFHVFPDSNNPEIRIKLRRICNWEIEV